MHRIKEEIEDFNSFVKEHLTAETNISLDELYDHWRESHPAEEDFLAVQSSLRDMENGEIGRPFEEFAADFVRINHISDRQ